MKENLTDITVVLDRSGSMISIKNDTIGGFNTFLSEQQKADGEGLFSLVQFDDKYEVVQDGVDLKKAVPLTADTFVPRGWTALLDAIGKTIVTTGERLSKMTEDERPAKVVFVILTDGEENASKEYGQQRINDMISHQREADKWEFVFLGANQDAISAAKNIGIPQAAAITYAANAQGTNDVFCSVSRNVASYRGGLTKSANFSDDDRKKQRDAGVK